MMVRVTEIELTEARALAESLRKVYTAVAERIGADNAASPLITKVTGHLGCPLSDVVVVEEKYRLYEHAALQVAADLYLDAHSPGAQWFGIVGGERRWESIINMLLSAMREGSRMFGRPDYGTAPIGPDATIEVVQLGLVATTAPDGSPVVIGLSNRDDYDAYSLLTVLSAGRQAATAVRGEIDRLMREHDPFRGQVLSFGFSEHRDNELLTFLPRPELGAEEVILPEGRLEAIEDHIVGIAELAGRLTAAGQHLRRGLLLYGPPGTGKTHTTRYLIGRLRDHTAVLMTGPAMRKIDYAVAMARKLAPSIVVVEDVDLIAEDRSQYETSPLLFSLLDAMDGISGDVDVTFVLTTNRVEALEKALVQRPGRVDLAVEIPPPDAAARERLILLYARNQPIVADVAKVVAATEGVTASFIKELLRRVILVALRSDEPALTDGHFDTALQAMAGDNQALTRALLGSQETGTVTGPKDERAPARLQPPSC
ncbi:ATPase family protein associated with various cellular activities (AAA) [Nonomuraea polychroma]|uniref:ATPase family protein associated with various cellular activities (AAA) n=1 Tax=Nonomuraea polychroma TaxID=46176 RepID=A0A438LZW9_9ACTN|nr:ATPase family protein associated with various cellular activities (AAA) [Nonomuraea polychroma]